MPEPHLTLFSSDLLSKWGFNDGDDPEPWLDWCEAQGIDYTTFDIPWAALVRKYLVPLIEQDVTVIDIETIHNPIRAETVNGADMHEVLYGKADAPALTPESVDVPMADVLALALAEAGLTAAPRHTPPLPLS